MNKYISILFVIIGTGFALDIDSLKLAQEAKFDIPSESERGEAFQTGVKERKCRAVAKTMKSVAEINALSGYTVEEKALIEQYYLEFYSRTGE